MSCNTEFPAGEYPSCVYGPNMNAVGRRPGKVDTKGDIIEAATRVFARKGYDGASLRAIAREAGVDPALVHHYFDGKASLFVAAMALPFDPRAVKDGAGTGAKVGGPDVEAFSPCGIGPRAPGPTSRRAPPPWPRPPPSPTRSASSWPNGSGAS